MRAVIGGITGAASEARTEMQADGSRLRYYAAGTGPPLVLIHTVRTQLELPTSDSAAGGPLHRLCAGCEGRSITRWDVLNSQL